MWHKVAAIFLLFETYFTFTEYCRSQRTASLDKQGGCFFLHFSAVGTKPQQHASTWTDTWIWFKAAWEPQPVRYRGRGTDNNAHYSLFRTIDCKMLAACRLTLIKEKIQNKVLTTGVNKAPFPKTFTNGGLYGSLLDFLKILLPCIYKNPKINGTFYQFWCCVIVQLESHHQCGL